MSKFNKKDLELAKKIRESFKNVKNNQSFLHSNSDIKIISSIEEFEKYLSELSEKDIYEGAQRIKEDIYGQHEQELSNNLYLVIHNGDYQFEILCEELGLTDIKSISSIEVKVTEINVNRNK